MCQTGATFSYDFSWWITCQVIAEHLSVEEVEVIRDMFKLMDTNNNGQITFEELKAGLQKVGSQLAEPEMQMLMEAVIVFILHSLF